MQPIPVKDWIGGLNIDGFTGATPLALQKFQHIEVSGLDLFTGMVAGSAGETSALLIMICGLGLAYQRLLDWKIPAGVMLGAVLIALPFWLLDGGVYPTPWFVLCSGGLMLGAWFMASDMVGSPETPWGALVYGLFIGALTVVIRLFGGLTEGIMYAILLANAAAPLISAVTQPRVFGTLRRDGHEWDPPRPGRHPGPGYPRSGHADDPGAHRRHLWPTGGDGLRIHRPHHRREGAHRHRGGGAAHPAGCRRQTRLPHRCPG
jgi:hypothetical protein